MQTIAKTLDSSDARAIALIGVYAFYTGCFMLLGIATPILRLKVYDLDRELIIIAMAIALLGWLLSGNLSKSVTKSCYYNLAISYSPRLLMAIALLWSSILLIFGLDFSQVITEGLISGVWAVVAATLIATAFRIGSVAQFASYNSFKSNFKNTRSTNSKQEFNLGIDRDLDRLSITNDSDSSKNRTIVSPKILAQQPQQFKGLMCLVLSLFVWTILDLPEGIAELAAIALGTLGLTGLSTWQVLLCPIQRLILIQFSGIWGMASSFTIDLVQFSRLETIKLKEVDLQWLQLAGTSKAITLPVIVTEVIGKKSQKLGDDKVDDKSELGLIETLAAKLNLAEHKVSRDPLSVMDILLPQSVGMLAGLVILGMGVTFSVLLPLPTKMPLETYMLLTGSCLVSPCMGRFILGLVAPSTMVRDDRSDSSEIVWQVGAGLIMIAMFSSYKVNPQPESLLTLALIWLCCGIGGCILALSRRSPLMTKR